MLTIGKLGTSRGRLEFYDAQVAAGAEDYYAGRGESPGRWRGAGARGLGLASGGRVSRAEFMALMRGLDPRDGSVLRVMGTRSTVAGFDLTFSAPKSVSVLFAVDDEHVASALLAAHERAVDSALGYLEREACWTRRGRDGADRVRGEGFIGAAYRHRMSRAGDPQLHTHVVVANMTCADGRYTALDAGRSSSTSRLPVRSIAPCCAPRSGNGCRGCPGTRPAAGCLSWQASPERCCGISRSDASRSKTAQRSSLVWVLLEGCRGSGCRGSRWPPAQPNAMASTDQLGVRRRRRAWPSTGSATLSSTPCAIAGRSMRRLLTSLR